MFGPQEYRGEDAKAFLERSGYGQYAAQTDVVAKNDHGYWVAYREAGQLRVPIIQISGPSGAQAWIGAGIMKALGFVS